MRLSSTDRVSGSLNSFNVDFSSLPRFQEVRSVEVKYIGFPHVQTNVNTGTNTFILRRPDYYFPPFNVSGFRMTVTGQPVPQPTVTLDFGLPNANGEPYKVDDMVAFINQRLDSGVNSANPAANLRCSVRADTLRLQFDIDDGEFEMGPVANGIGPFPEMDSATADLLKFGPIGSGITNGPVTTYTGGQLFIQPLTFADTIFTVPVGQYTAPELAALLTTTVNTQEPTWNFTCEIKDENINPRFVFTSTERLIYVSSRDVPTSTLSDLLGIIDSSQGSGGTLAFTPDYTPAMNGLPCAWLHCKAIALARAGQAQNNPERKQAISLAIVSQVPVNVPWRDYVNFEPKTDNMIIYSTPVNLCSMEFRLREQWHGGRLVDLCYPGISVCIEVDIK